MRTTDINNPLKLYTRTEAAKALRLCLKSLDLAVKHEEIATVRLGSNRGKILFREADLLAFTCSRVRPLNPAAI